MNKSTFLKLYSKRKKEEYEHVIIFNNFATVTF